ncbi:MAG: hypothetical protein LBP74_03195 [Treponema sp.]|nr:hypothetical protein [Treponema sp.]
MVFSVLPGQEAAPQGDVPADTDTCGPFPLSLLMDAVLSGEISWRPDWPVAMPPDGFTPISGGALSIILTLPVGFLDTVPGSTGGAKTDGDAANLEYRITWNARGRFLELPFCLNGTFYQAAVVYDPMNPELIRKITLENPASPDPWEFEFLQYSGEAPSLARINIGGTWYFVAPEYLDRRVNETWYDPEGLVQAFFSLEYREVEGKKRLISVDSRSDQGEAVLIYEYNSARRISGLSTPETTVTALYTVAVQPRYWERPGENYTLQWDENGFLTRLTGVLTGDTPEPQLLDIRYDYVLDARGNWTERKEVSFVRRFGRLVPEAETTITRAITYEDN